MIAALLILAASFAAAPAGPPPVTPEGAPIPVAVWVGDHDRGTRPGWIRHSCTTDHLGEITITTCVEDPLVESASSRLR